MTTIVRTDGHPVESSMLLNQPIFFFINSAPRLAFLAPVTDKIFRAEAEWMK